MKKIIISGYNVSGFGGMETVFNIFNELLTNSINCKYEILFVFFEDKDKTLSDAWLGNKKYLRLYSNIKNTKIRRINFAYQYSKILSEYLPDYIISYDAIGCYIASWARRFSLKSSPTIYSWHHFSLDNFYKIEYLLLADQHLSISSGITSQLLQLGASKNSIHTIYNPITPTSDIITRVNNHSFIYVGRILYKGQKNLQELFNALSKLPNNWTLDIVGSGESEEIAKLNILAEKLNINDKITWHGWQKSPWEYIKNNIKNVTCLIMTSTYEGFGMVLAEAISRGIYCISADCKTGPKDIINDKNGKLYPVGNVDALTNELQKIINGCELPSHSDIYNSINHLYEDKYIERVLSALDTNKV